MCESYKSGIFQQILIFFKLPNSIFSEDFKYLHLHVHILGDMYRTEAITDLFCAVHIAQDMYLETSCSKFFAVYDLVYSCAWSDSV